MPRFASRVALGTLAVAAAAGVALAATSARVPRPPAGAELAALAQPPARTSIASQRIYFVLTDRYANGDTANDRGGLAGDRTVTGYVAADPGRFHGGDFRGLTGGCTDTRTGLARLRELGFTAVWVTPPVRQKAVQGDSAAYHGYWGLDFTTVDPHLGSEQDFADFVACAHRLGMKVYLDVVVNHTADVIQLSDTRYVGPEQRPYRDCRGRRFNPARYAGRRTFPCLRASRMPRLPTVPAAERDAKRPAWLNDPRRYHNRGNIDFSACDPTCLEQGDFFGLDDLFTEQRAVVNGLAQMHADWIRRFKVDGFRIDTARHVDRAFFRIWVPQVLAAARAAGVPEFELFGEVWLTDVAEQSAYVRERRLPNVLDFPFQAVAAGFASARVGALAVANRLDDDDYYRYSPAVAPTPPTFLGNHDMGRAALVIRERTGAEGAALLQRVLLGYDLMYLLRGAPVVYYGDEVGMIGTGGDKAARQDMFPTQVQEWRTEERVGSPPIGAGSAFDVVDHPIANHLRTLAALRDAHPALATGATVVRRAQGNVLVVSRIDAGARREYVAAFNAGAGVAQVTVPTATRATTWRALLGAAGAASDASGRLALAVPPVSAVLLRADTDVAVAPASAPSVTVTPDDVTGLRAVRARVTGAAPVSVSFAVRRARAARWSLLGADDSPPYRALLDQRRYRRKERVYVVAIVRSLDGSTAVSRVVGLTPRRR